MTEQNGKKMVEKDQTPEGNDENQTPEEGTAVEKDTPKEPERGLKKTTEPVVDYKAKFRDSQRESIKLAKKIEELEKKSQESGEKPETIETKSEGETLDEIVEKKVQEKIAPLTASQEREVVDKWLDKNPEAMDYLKEIEEAYLNQSGKTTQEKLENAFLIAKKDVMKEAGKKEMAFNLYQKEQAVASGGGVSSSGTEGSLPSLSEEEKQVARSLGLDEEAYAKRKGEKK